MYIPCTWDEQASVMSLIGVATAKSRENAARRRGNGAILSETFFSSSSPSSCCGYLSAGSGLH
jgi:hypothetical protein